MSTFGTGSISEDSIRTRVERHFDFRLRAIIRDFNLRRSPALHRDGFYRNLPAQGHFGASFTELPWERPDKADLLGSA